MAKGYKDTDAVPPSKEAGMKDTLKQYSHALQKVKADLNEEEEKLKFFRKGEAKKKASLEAMLVAKNKELAVIQQKIVTAETDFASANKEQIKAIKATLKELKGRTELLDQANEQLVKDQKDIIAREHKVSATLAEVEAKESMNEADGDFIKAEKKRLKELTASTVAVVDQNNKIVESLENTKKQIADLRDANTKILESIQSESKWLKQRTQESVKLAEKAEIKTKERTAFDSLKKEFEAKLANLQASNAPLDEKAHELRALELALRGTERELIKRENILKKAEANLPKE